MARFQDLVSVVEDNFGSRVSNEGLESFRKASADLATMLSAPSEVVSLLRDYLRLAEAGQVPCGSSHQHPNGFEKLSVYRSTQSDARVRVHVWWDGLASMESTIHDHRWHFASHVLAGRMVATNFRETDAGAPGAEEYHCSQTSDILADQEKQIQALGKRALQAVSSYVLNEGDAHALHAEVPHQVIAESGTFSATIVITGAPVRTHSLTFRRVMLTASSRHYEVYPRNMMLQRLGSLIEHLAHRAGGRAAAG